MTPRLEYDDSQLDRGLFTIRLCGDWTLEQRLPRAADLGHRLAVTPGVRRIGFAVTELARWETGLLTFLRGVQVQCTVAGIQFDPTGLPAGVQRLLALAAAVPAREGARGGAARPPFLHRVGTAALGFGAAGVDWITFTGDCCLALVAWLRRRARFQPRDVFLLMQECGAGALPIVSLICLLVGLILAFVGAVQLQVFGAQIYVASLVGIAMVRVMGAIMTGIIMAGRTGAAFAARLGTMQVNEEIDALRTLGISPVEFLVLPRLLALMLMMPLLVLYADIMGIVGGLIVGVGMLDLSAVQYLTQTWASVRLQDLAIGVLHGAVFGVLVALAGCRCGMNCGRSASAVGDATTAAVVSGIISVIVATAVITVVCNVLGV